MTTTTPRTTTTITRTTINTTEDIRHAFYINLEHRTDRKEHVEQQLTSVGITTAQRFNAIRMENGAIGCSMSHLAILKKALAEEYDHVLIVEDDIQFLNPALFTKQFAEFFKSMKDNQWDVLLLGGNNSPPFHYVNPACVRVARCQTTTGYLVNGHYIETLIKNIKTGLTHLLSKPHMRTMYAIDRYWFLLQEKDLWFLLTPLTVIQREDYSDIEKKRTNYGRAMTDLTKESLIRRSKQNP